MEKLFAHARGTARRFPNGNEPFQIVTRLLEECGEVAGEVNHWQDSGIKRLKHGEPSRENLANEIRQAMCALAQLAVYYGVEAEVESSIDRSIARLREEGYIE